jgi:hypothetical protein
VIQTPTGITITVSLSRPVQVIFLSLSLLAHRKGIMTKVAKGNMRRAQV